MHCHNERYTRYIQSSDAFIALKQQYTRHNTHKTTDDKVKCARAHTYMHLDRNRNSTCLSAMNASEDFYFVLYKFTHYYYYYYINEVNI